MLVIGFGYAWYFDQSLKNDMIHKGCMITGKYDVDSAQAEYLTGFYSRKHLQKPKFGFFSALKDKFFAWTCCCDSDEHSNLQTLETQPSEYIADKKDHEVLNKAFHGILDRQLDMKYVLQLIQDMELMKRVVFQERH
jgi:hypothetical protein